MDHLRGDLVWRWAEEGVLEQRGVHVIEWGAEFLGTAILLFGGLSAVALDFGPRSPVALAIPSHSSRLLVTGILFAGTGSLVAISPIGRRSGAHINPAISLAFWLTRHMHHGDFAGYVVAQFAGAIVGVAAWRVAWGPIAGSVNYGMTLPGAGVGDITAAVVEAAMTAALVLTIFAFVARRRTMRWTPFAVWVLVAALVWQVAPITGTSLNPARSTGPALWAVDLGSLWVYFIGPLSGAVVAVGITHVLADTLWPRTAKLFHDPRYPSVFKHSSPPAVDIGSMMPRRGPTQESRP